MVGCTISWTSGSDVTKTKKKKGKGKKKATKVARAKSFFNFFESHDSAAADLPGKKVLLQGEMVEEMSPELEYLEADYKLAQDIRDSVIPLAIENYLGVLDDSDDEASDGSHESA